ncbi:MAG TPA: BrnT family toxin [Terracidiphilus sp.]|nr:BrnT family toxin [Terracidiphilus sp.]
MAITYDSAKNERNIRERGLSFDRAADFDFDTAVFNTELRKGEMRRIAVGYLDKRLHLLCYIPQHDGIRVISFRKTNKREAQRYGKAQTID